MLPNRTYNELNESCFSQTELSEEAKLRAGLSARKNRRSSLQLTADRKTLIAIYKKMQEKEEQWGALEALFRDFYIVERVLNDCDERPRRLPVLLHGTYDFIATYEYDGYAWIFVAFVVLLFAAAYRMIKKLSRDDRFIDGNDYYHYDGPEF